MHHDGYMMRLRVLVQFEKFNCPTGLRPVPVAREPEKMNVLGYS